MSLGVQGSRRPPSVTQPRQGLGLFDLAVFVYAALIPFESLTFGSGSVVRAWGLVLAVTGVARAVAVGFRIGPRALGLLLAPCLLAAMSYWWTLDPGATAQRTGTLLLLGGLAVLIAACGTPRTLNCAVLGVIAGGTAAAILVMQDYESIIGTAANEIRSTAASANANDLATVMAVASILALGLALTTPNRRSGAILGLCALACGAAVVLTASRTATGDMILGVTVLVLRRRTHLFRRVLILGTGIAIAGVRHPSARPPRRGRLEGAYSSARTGDLNYGPRCGARRGKRLPSTRYSGGVPAPSRGVAKAEWSRDCRSQQHHRCCSPAWAGRGNRFRCSRCHDRNATASVPSGAGPDVLMTSGLVLFVNMMLLSWDYRKLPWLFVAMALLAASSRPSSRPSVKSSGSVPLD